MKFSSKRYSIENLPTEERNHWITIHQNSIGLLGSPFLSYCFASAVNLSGGQCFVDVFYGSDGMPIAYFPYQFSSRLNRFLGLAERIGGNLCDISAPLSSTLSTSKFKIILENSAVNGFHVSHAPTELIEELPISNERLEIGLAAQIENTGLEYWNSKMLKNRSYSQDLNRCERRLADFAKDLKFEISSSQTEELLDLLIELKRKQFRRTNVPDAFNQSWKIKLLKILAKSVSESCIGVFSWIYEKRSPIALHFGLKSKTVFSYWLPTYAAEYSRFSPGKILLKNILTSIPARSTKYFDFGLGDSSYKRQVANFEYTMSRGYWFKPGLSGFLCNQKAKIDWRLP